MKVKECMSREVRTIKPEDSLREAARLMAEMDVGCLPVASADGVVGMVTDRDIAVRGVAAGKTPDSPVSQVMSSEVRYCFEDEEIETVAHNMGDQQVRRLPVMSREKRLVGIISLGDLAAKRSRAEIAGEALTGISRSGGAHSQTGNTTQH
jgi:CBS domain-containing protein